MDRWLARVRGEGISEPVKNILPRSQISSLSYLACSTHPCLFQWIQIKENCSRQLNKFLSVSWTEQSMTCAILRKSKRVWWWTLSSAPALWDLPWVFSTHTSSLLLLPACEPRLPVRPASPPCLRWGRCPPGGCAWRRCGRRLESASASSSASSPRPTSTTGRKRRTTMRSLGGETVCASGAGGASATAATAATATTTPAARKGASSGAWAAAASFSLSKWLSWHSSRRKSHLLAAAAAAGRRRRGHDRRHHHWRWCPRLLRRHRFLLKCYYSCDIETVRRCPLLTFTQ